MWQHAESFVSEARDGLDDVELESGEIRRLRKLLVAAIVQVCPPWLRGQAEDIAQPALLKIVQAQRDSGAPIPQGYVRKTAYSAVVDEMRRRRIRPHDQPDSPTVDTSIDARPDAPERLADAELGAAIGDCLGTVADDRRRAVVLHLQGFARHEIAELLGVAGKRTDNLIYRGLGDLRRCLRSKGYEP